MRLSRRFKDKNLQRNLTEYILLRTETNEPPNLFKRDDVGYRIIRNTPCRFELFRKFRATRFHAPCLLEYPGTCTADLTANLCRQNII